ncbi:MAG: TfoX/Sxy family protein [Chloroflexi bacterium]|nr:TfoX/Sxy family protein [Chloroflexota bacterium]
MDAKWKKPSSKLVETFEHIFPKAPGVERRKMFGYPCAFANGVWFMGCFGENDIVLKLSGADRKDFLALEGAAQFTPMPGRPMKEMVMVPASMMKDEAQLRLWVGRSLAYAMSLPPKPGRKK